MSVRFKGVHKRFRSYEEASRFLNGLRFKTDEQTFDDRDYKKEQPLSFTNMSAKWLETKKGKVSDGQYGNLWRYIQRASLYFQHKNVKDIDYGELEDCLLAQVCISDKTRANMKSCLHSFFSWLKRRKEINHVPDFPEVSYRLGMRNTTDKETQERIIEEVGRICPYKKVWLGIMFLATYIAIRPHELLNLRWEDIDLVRGYIFIPRPKEKTPKDVPLRRDDITLLKTMSRGLPEVFFFRHSNGEQYGDKYFYKWWIRACENLGIKDLVLYGGTRHTTVKWLRTKYSFETVKKATCHSTNKAFERYFQFEGDDIREVYQNTRIGKGMVKEFTTPSQSNLP
jgi:integrase